MEWSAPAILRRRPRQRLVAETLIHHAGDGSVVGAADVAVSDGEPAEATIAGRGIAGLLKAANLRQLRSVPTAAAAR